MVCCLNTARTCRWLLRSLGLSPLRLVAVLIDSSPLVPAKGRQHTSSGCNMYDMHGFHGTSHQRHTCDLAPRGRWSRTETTWLRKMSSRSSAISSHID